MPDSYLPADYGAPQLLAPLRDALAGLSKARAAGTSFLPPRDPFTGLPAPAPLRVAVALSGGADSAMLAVHAAVVARSRAGIELHCFHIHHGLQEPADAWLAQAHRLAAGLRVPCHSLRVDVVQHSGKGVEAAAREARYAGLKRLAAATDVTHVFLAHHRNDQSETVLLRLLRGSGPTGLAAMAPRAERDGLIYIRPWLDVDRACIMAAAREYTARTGWEAVDDPTNVDEAYTRGAVRRRLSPVLDERWPAWRGILARHARQARDLAMLAEEIAAEDLARLDLSPGGEDFCLDAWRKLGAQRQVLALRHWLALHGLRAPSDARMQELCRQLRGLHALGHDRSMRLRHEGRWISCVRGRVRLSRSNDTDESR